MDMSSYFPPSLSVKVINPNEKSFKLHSVLLQGKKTLPWHLPAYTELLQGHLSRGQAPYVAHKWLEGSLVHIHLSYPFHWLA